MSELASAWSEAHLDLDTLDRDGREAKKKLQKMVREWENLLKVDIEVNLDTSKIDGQMRELSADIKRSVAQIEQTEITLDVKVEDESIVAAAVAAREKAQEAVDKAVEVGVLLDSDRFDREWAALQARLAALGQDIDVSVDVETEDLEALQARLRAMQAEFDDLMNRSVHLDVDIDDDAFFERVAALRLALENLPKTDIPVGVDVDTEEVELTLEQLADRFVQRFNELTVKVGVDDAQAAAEAAKARAIMDRQAGRITTRIYTQVDEKGIKDLKNRIQQVSNLLDKGSSAKLSLSGIDRNLAREALDETVLRIRRLREETRERIELGVGMDPVDKVQLLQLERRLKRLNDQAVVTRVKANVAGAIKDLLKLTGIRTALSRTVAEIRVKVSEVSVAERVLGGLKKTRDALGTVTVGFIMRGHTVVADMMDRLRALRRAFDDNPIVMAVRDRGLKAAVAASERLRSIRETLSKPFELGLRASSVRGVSTAMLALDAVKTRLSKVSLVGLKESGGQAIRTLLLGIDAVRTRITKGPLILRVRNVGLKAAVQAVQGFERLATGAAGAVSRTFTRLSRLWDGRRGIFGKLRSSAADAFRGLGNLAQAGFRAVVSIGQSAWSALSEGAVSVGKSLFESLSKGFNDLRAIGANIGSNLISNLPQMAVTLAMIGAIGTLVLGVVGAITVAVGAAVAAIGALIGALIALAAGAAVALASTVGLAVAAVLIDERAKTAVLDQVKVLMGEVSQAFAPVTELIVNQVIPAFTGIARELIPAAASVAADVIVPLSASLFGLVDALIPLITEISGPMAEGLASIFDTITKFAPTFADIGLAIGPPLTDALNAILEVMLQLGDAFKNDIGAAFQVIADSFRSMSPDLQSFAGVLEPTFDLLMRILEVIVQVGAEVGPKFEQVFQDVTDQAGTWTEILRIAAEIAVALGKNFVFVVDVIDALIAGTREAAGVLANVLGRALDVVLMGVRTLAGAILTVVETAVRGYNLLPTPDIDTAPLTKARRFINETTDAIGAQGKEIRDNIEGWKDWADETDRTANLTRRTRQALAQEESGLTRINEAFAAGKLSLGEYAEAGRIASGVFTEYNAVMSASEQAALATAEAFNSLIGSLDPGGDTPMAESFLGNIMDSLTNQDLPGLADFLDEENPSILAAIDRRGVLIAAAIQTSQYVIDAANAGYDHLASFLGELTPQQIQQAMKEIGDVGSAGMAEANRKLEEQVRASTPSIEAAIDERGRIIGAALERTSFTQRLAEAGLTELAGQLQAMTPEQFAAFMGEVDALGEGALGKLVEWNEKLRTQNQFAAEVAAQEARAAAERTVQAGIEGRESALAAAANVGASIGVGAGAAENAFGIGNSIFGKATEEAGAAAAEAGAAFQTGLDEAVAGTTLSGIIDPGTATADAGAAGTGAGQAFTTGFGAQTAGAVDALTVSVNAALTIILSTFFVGGTNSANRFVGGFDAGVAFNLPGILATLIGIANMSDAALLFWVGKGGEAANGYAGALIGTLAIQQVRIISAFVAAALLIATNFIAALLAPINATLPGLLYNSLGVAFGGVAPLGFQIGVAIGQAVAAGVAAGIVSGIAAARQAAIGLALAVDTGARIALDINSPSRVMEQIGVQAAAGLVAGLQSESAAAIAAAAALSTAIADQTVAGLAAVPAPAVPEPTIAPVAGSSTDAMLADVNSAQSAFETAGAGLAAYLHAGFGKYIRMAAENTAGSRLLTSTMLPEAAAAQPAFEFTGYALGAALTDGLEAGLAAGIERVRAVAIGLATAVGVGVREALEIQSPSRVMERLGLYAGEGLAVGLAGSAARVAGAASGLSALVPQAATQATIDGLRAAQGTLASQVDQSRTDNRQTTHNWNIRSAQPRETAAQVNRKMRDRDFLDGEV